MGNKPAVLMNICVSTVYYLFPHFNLKKTRKRAHGIFLSALLNYKEPFLSLEH